MTLKLFLMLLVSISLGCAGQVCMKIGLNTHGEITSFVSLMTAMIKPGVVVGLGLMVVSSMLYLTLMSKMDLSLLYPMVALNYVFVTVISHFVFHEQVSSLRVAALATIILGVTMIGMSAPKKAGDKAPADDPNSPQIASAADVESSK